MKTSKINTFIKSKLPQIVGSAVGLSTAVLAFSVHATTAEDLNDIADAVGTSFQTNAVLMLTNILPYVVTISVVFLAAKLALRWIKRSAH